MSRIVMRALALLAGLAPAAGPHAQDLRFFTIGSGDVAGGYYATANALCDSVNREARGEMRCSPDPTAGSIYNLDALRSGQIDFALVQSDWQRQAVKGTGRYAALGPMSDLRSVMGLYPETVTILARADAGIEGTPDLPGRRIDIGHTSSGRNATNRQLFEALGLAERDFALVTELSVGTAIDELCAGRIDATVLIVGHPNSMVGRALSTCDAVLVPAGGPDIDAFVAANDDYLPTTVPAGTYPSLETDVKTFSVTATLVTRAGAAPDIVARLVSTTVEDLPAIAQAAPVLSGVRVGDLPVQGLTAPLHPAAETAYATAPSE